MGASVGEKEHLTKMQLRFDRTIRFFGNSIYGNYCGKSYKMPVKTGF